MRTRVAVVVVLVALSGCFAPVHSGSYGGQTPHAIDGSDAAVAADESDSSIVATLRAAMDRLELGRSDDPARIVTLGFSPSYDAAAVLDRVERIRGLTASGTIVVHQYPYYPDSRVNLANRYAGIRPAGAAALGLASNRSVPAPQPLGYTVEEDGVIHVSLLSPDGMAANGVRQEAVLAHELTHALQFQHDLLSMSRADLQADFERWTTDAQLTATAVFEGDATAVMVAYQRRYLPDANPVTPSDAVDRRSSWVQSVSLAPYYYGYHYFTARNATSEDRSRAIRDPPSSTSDLLQPTVDLPARPPPPLPESVGNETYSRMATDRLGELMIRRALRLNGVEPERAAAAARGWANGQMGYYRTAGDGTEGDGTAVHWKTVWENEAEAEQFLRTWRSMLESRNATGMGGLTYVPPTEHSPGQFYAVQQSNETVSVTAGGNVTVARGVLRALQVSSSWSSANSSSTASSSAGTSSVSVSPSPFSAAASSVSAGS